MIFTDRNICPECGTENENEYAYCKNCGCRLTTEPDKKGRFDGGSNPPYAKTRQADGGEYSSYVPPNVDREPPHRESVPKGSAQYSADGIDGIPIDEIEIFAGANSADFIKKFIRMECTGSKVSWCWPVAILGFLLGPAGSAIWFFRRKMYKIASILLALGLILAAVNVAAGAYLYDAVDMAGFEEGMEAFFEGSMSTAQFGEIVAELLDSAAEPSFILFTLGISFFEKLITAGPFVVCSLFAVYWYKCHAVNRIRKYRMSCIDPRYYRLGLSAIGGTSGGMMALGIVCVALMRIISENIITVLM